MADLYPDAEAGFAFDNEVLQEAIKRIYERKFNPMTEIDTGLFNAVWNTLNIATNEGYGERTPTDPDFDFYHELRYNNAVFSAFKVHRAQNDMAKLLLDSKGNLKSFEQWSKEVKPIASHQFDSWLHTEYDTAVLRARLAADWKQFEREADVLPNIRWIPSTSIHPGADHRIFWNTVRPIDDPFWSQHHPGDRWNCKCGLENTDDPVTDIPYVPENDKPSPGLDNHPEKDAKLFSYTHPYIKHAYKGAEKAVDKLMKRINEMIAEMPDNLTADEKMAIAKNNLEIEKALGITKGKPMTYDEANKGKENPNFKQSYAYKVNCQTCVPVHVLRRLGFDVEAAPNINNSAYKLMDKQKIVWNKNLFMNADGTDSTFIMARTWAKENNIKRIGEKEIRKFLVENMKEDGLYEIYCAWKGKGAHVFCAEIKKGSIKLFDPQLGVDNVLGYIREMKGNSVGVLRIDNKLINPKASGLFIKHL